MILRVLIVEPDGEELLFLQDALREIEQERLLPEWSQIEPQCAVTVEEAAQVLSTSPPQALLLEAGLRQPEKELVRMVQEAALITPVIVLADPAQEELATRLMREGAQDFLFKKQTDCVPLAHALGNAVLRHKLLAAARGASLVDSLTGLPNRNAFLALAARDRKLAERLGRRWMILVAEPRNLRQIARALGEQRRDLDLLEASEQLRGLITPADLLARVSERHFAISVFDGEAESAEEAWARIRGAAAQARIEVGASIFDPSLPLSVDAMLERALADLPGPPRSAHMAGAA